MQIAQRLRHQIISGAFQPGQPMPSLASLERDLGYHRVTIAKALRLLAGEGLIYRPAGLSYYVRAHRQHPAQPSPAPASTPGQPAAALSWRGTFTNAELNALHAEGFGHRVLDDDWQAQLSRHSLGWVTARDSHGELAGFVNVAWDGGVHAFLLDTLVTATARHTGIGTALVQVAAAAAKDAGCEWLHVDFEDHLRPFYFGRCGFTPTNAGLYALTGPTP